MRLCMISLDAVAQPDADRLLSLSAFSALAENGVFCGNVKTIYPTLTYPIHTSLITGCYPTTHGIGHNQPFQPDTPPNMRKWYWSVGDIQAKTLYQAAKEKRMDVASILWPVSGKNRFVRRNFPEVLPLPGESAVKKMLEYASPVWILRMEARYGKTRKSIHQPDLDDYAPGRAVRASGGLRRHAPQLRRGKRRSPRRHGTPEPAGGTHHQCGAESESAGRHAFLRGQRPRAAGRAEGDSIGQSAASHLRSPGAKPGHGSLYLRPRPGRREKSPARASGGMGHQSHPGMHCQAIASSTGRKKPLANTASAWTAPRPGRCCGFPVPASALGGESKKRTSSTSRQPWPML